MAEGRTWRTRAQPTESKPPKATGLETRLSLLSSRNTATASAVSLFLEGHLIQHPGMPSAVLQQIQLTSQAMGAQNKVLRATTVMLVAATEPSSTLWVEGEGATRTSSTARVTPGVGSSLPSRRIGSCTWAASSSHAATRCVQWGVRSPRGCSARPCSTGVALSVAPSGTWLNQPSSTGDWFLSRRETRIVPGVPMPPTSAHADWNWNANRLKAFHAPLERLSRPQNPPRWNRAANRRGNGFAGPTFELESRLDAA